MFQRLSFIVLSVATLAVASCKKSPETVTYAGTNLPLTASQVVPVPTNPSPATGSINASYDNNTRTLSYTVNWSNTTDSVTTVRVSGPAEAGYNSTVTLQTFTNSTSAQTVPPRRRTATYTQNLAVDNVVVKEAELLAGLYYISVFTKASSTVPELRGQIVLRQTK